MSILSTIAYYCLSNSIALDKWLGDTEERVTRDSDFWRQSAHIAFMQRDSSRPGHVFDRRWEAVIQKYGNPQLPDFLDMVGEEYLELRHGRLYAKGGENFARWQNIRSRMTTLPIKTRFLYHYKLQSLGGLAHPYAPCMNDLIKNEGLSETHLHVNLYAFPEECWLHYLYNISLFLKERETTRETDQKLFEIISPGLSPIRMANRMGLAVILRNTILEMVKSSPCENHQNRLAEVEKAKYFLSLSQESFTNNPASWVSIPTDVPARLEEERRMWNRAFYLMDSDEFCYKHALQNMLHLYLLIENEFIQLYYHAEKRRGFEAFSEAAQQNRTFVGSREYYKSTFLRIFNASRPKGKTCIELRLPPQGVVDRHHDLYYALKEAWDEYQMEHNGGSHEKCPHVILVAHFIKKKCLSKGNGVQGIVSELYGAESSMYMKEAAAFADRVKNILPKYQFSIGIDAAGFEFETPPEVLAPAFRLFSRQSLVQHKTYHCGEDFHHLISGIRAIYEAIEFLDLEKGNRIGHATAIGISPETWLKSMPAKIVLPRSEWFFNLIFARRFLNEVQQVRRVETELANIANVMFGEDLSFSVLDGIFDARRLSSRYLSPSHITCSPNGLKEKELCQQFAAERGKLVLDYYETWRMDSEIRQKQNELIEVNADFLPIDALLQLQQRIQKHIVKKDIVIETLLTSNVRISQYNDHFQHHILRWLMIDGYKEEGDVAMNICMGSDDPGIFVTDIKNEYYHLYNVLTRAKLTPSEAMEHIRRLNETGRIYSFTSIPLANPEDDSLSWLQTAVSYPTGEQSPNFF